MVNYIEFTKQKYDKDYNSMADLTKNTIILCPNYKTMASFAEEIFNTVNEKAEYNNYDCDTEDIGTAKYLLNFGLQKIIQVNDQTITLALEPSIIYKAETAEDIWFIDYCGKDEDYRESIYALTSFIGCEDFWRKGKNYIYKMLVNGKFGCYEGQLLPQKDFNEND